MAIDKSNRICGWSKPLTGRFSALKKATSPKDSTFATSIYSKRRASVTLQQPLMSAAMLYMGEQIETGRKLPEAAIGKMPNGEWIAEVQAKDNDDIRIIVIYNPMTGHEMAGAYNVVTKKMLPVDPGNTGVPVSSEFAYETDGTELWYAMMPEILSDPEAQTAISSISAILESGAAFEDTQRDWTIFCDNVYARAEKAEAPSSALITINDPGKTGPLRKISEPKLISGNYSVNEVIKGGFTLVERNIGGGASGKAKLEKEDTSIGWEFPAQVQPFMIDNMDHYVPKQNVADMVRIIKAGEEHPELRIRNFFLVGPPGSGKSEDAKAFAYYGGMPFMVMCLSSGVTEENLKGFIAPSIGNTDLTEEEAAAVEAVSSLFPSGEFIELASDDAYEKLTGKRMSGVSLEEVYATAYEKLLAEAERRDRSPRTSAEGANGVSYRYLPSPLVLAARFGGVVEIQEPSSVADPTVLTCLNEFMNKPDGVLDTPVGQIRRNPHCVIVMTDNYSTDIGNSNMNQAVKDRAGTVTFWYERASNDTMVSMVKKQGIDVDEMKLNAMAEVIDVVDSEAQKMDNSIKAVAGYRSFLAWAQNVAMGFDVVTAMERCVINKMASNPEERELLIDVVENNTRIHEL